MGKINNNNSPSYHYYYSNSGQGSSTNGASHSSAPQQSTHPQYAYAQQSTHPQYAYHQQASYGQPGPSQAYAQAYGSNTHHPSHHHGVYNHGSAQSVGYGGAPQASQFCFVKQPKTYPDSNLCAFYALHHFFNGQVSKSEFIQRASTKYQQVLGMSAQEAQALVLDGNDPSALSLYGLNPGSETDLRNKGQGIVANVNTGHFFAVRKENGRWTSYDSYNHSAPRQYKSFQDLKKAEIGNSQLYVM